MRFRHRVRQHLRSAGVVLKQEQRVIRAGALPPKLKAVFANKGGHARLVQQVGIGAGGLQIPVHGGRQAGDAVDPDVGKRFMPAGFGVNFGTQTERVSGGGGDVAGVGGGVPGHEVRPDHHQLTLAEIVAVLDGIGHGFAAVCADVAKGAELLTDGGECGRDLLIIQSRHAENTRLYAEFSLRGQQGFHAGIHAGVVRTAYDVGGGFRFGFTLCDAHHDNNRFSLVSNSHQGGAQRAGFTGLTGGGQYVGNEHRRIQREGRRIGILAGADHPNDGGGNGGDNAGAVIDFNNAHTVMIISHGVFPVIGVRSIIACWGQSGTAGGMFEQWHNAAAAQSDLTVLPGAGQNSQI
ncbi:hypothetical protein SRABI106_01990 [Rahnella aquatilis]|nr:hypothetical protein SRABI106_01990 [Rahnella aquatilis]